MLNIENAEYFATVRQNLKTIAEKVRPILEEVKDQDGPWSDEAINWARLGWVDVEFVIDEHGRYYRIIIENAAPNCRHLIGFVKSQLDDFELETEVVTEW